jgi:membrane protein DedA with SNARE-associated domain
MIAMLVIATLATIWFGRSTYRSLLLLQSAQATGSPQVSTVRGWMTLDYVSQTFNVPSAALVSGLELPADTSGGESLRAIAERQSVQTFEYVLRVQKVLAPLLPARARTESAESRSGDGLMDWVLVALQAYGYPALGLVLFLGAVGLPLPAGLSAALAGSLIALGHMWIFPVAGIAIGASLLGDTVGYGIGRWVDGNVLARYGRWIGYTQSRHDRARSIFDRLGGLTILLTRTLVSSLSSLVNLFAGASRYGTARFLIFAALGRMVWTSAYVSLGYIIAGDVEAAAFFLRQLSGLLIAATAAAGLAIYLFNPTLFSSRAAK